MIIELLCKVTNREGPRGTPQTRFPTDWQLRELKAQPLAVSGETIITGQEDQCHLPLSIVHNFVLQDWLAAHHGPWSLLRYIGQLLLALVAQISRQKIRASDSFVLDNERFLHQEQSRSQSVQPHWKDDRIISHHKNALTSIYELHQKMNAEWSKCRTRARVGPCRSTRMPTICWMVATTSCA